MALSPLNFLSCHMPLSVVTSMVCVHVESREEEGVLSVAIAVEILMSCVQIM